MKLSNPLARAPEAQSEPTVVPLFGAEQPITPELKQKMHRPIVVGAAVIGIGVVGLLGWAAVSQISSAVVAQGFVRVESNRKTLKAPEGGIVETINVREGQRVSRGELLIQFDDTRTRAQLDVLRSQYWNLLAERARYQAELANAGRINFPQELIAASATDPSIQAIISTQNDVFQARRILASSQTEVLNQRIQQLNTRIVGVQASVDSVDEQKRLIDEELVGLRDLRDRGFAAVNRVRATERQAAGLTGQKGERMAEIARSREQIGEARIELAKVRQAQVGEAAEALRQIEVRMAELLPKLRAAEEGHRLTRVVAPVDGYVLNLTQFTEGGVAGGGETLLDVVPSNAPLIVDARVRPQDADNVAPGLPARVRLSGLSRQFATDLEGDVVAISADRKLDPRNGEPYFDAQVRIRPHEMKKLAGKNVRINPGMPADTYILTGERSILDYVIGPLRDSLRDSMHEE